MISTKNIIFFDKIDSTNNYCLKLLKSNPPDDTLIVFAKQQTAGRGQRNNYWESEPGKNLLFSIICYPTFVSPDKQFNISKVISLGIFDYLTTFCNGVSIKWPNDIYIGDNKVGGVLIENTIRGNRIASTVAGVGINVNQTNFSSNLPNPVSLQQITQTHYALKPLLTDMLKYINTRYNALIANNTNTIHKAYLQSLYRFERMAWYAAANKKFKAKIINVEEFGYLIVQDENNEIKRFGFKEIKFLHPINKSENPADR